MPPRKDAAAGADVSGLIAGFDNKEVKLLAAAFLCSVGPDKYDYDLMATLTGNTAGTLKKMWPPVKKKAMESHSSFAKFLGASSSGTTQVTVADPPKPTAAKANAGRKRKTAEPEADADSDSDGTLVKPAGKKVKGKTADNKKAPAKGRGRSKKAKKAESSEDEETVEVSAKSDDEPDKDNSDEEA